MRWKCIARNGNELGNFRVTATDDENCDYEYNATIVKQT